MEITTTNTEHQKPLGNLTNPALTYPAQSIQSHESLILDLLPQKAPFRFVDHILHVDDESITATYTFRGDEFFYAGHFPGNPVTPGVIQIEAMAQVAVVAFGINLLMQDKSINPSDYLTLFTDVSAEFFGEIKPPQKVTIKGSKVFWRRNKLRAKATISLESGVVVAEATLSGMGVKIK